MTTLVTKLRLVVGVFVLFAMTSFVLPAAAQQAISDNPTASAVKEDQLLNQLKQIQGRGSIPDTKSYVIEQPAGRDWRHFREVTLRWIGGVAILGMVMLLVVFYLWRGMVRIEGGRSGLNIVRFNAFERVVHWMTAT
jgi:formate dehydrogenase subunit gamma